HYVEEAKSVRGSNEGQTRGCGWKEDADQQRVHRDNAEIIGPSPAASYALASSGFNEFPNCHQGKHTAKCGQPDILLTCEQGVAHGLFAPGCLDARIEFSHSIIRLNKIRSAAAQCRPVIQSWRCLPSLPPWPSRSRTPIASNCWSSSPRESAASRC